MDDVKKKRYNVPSPDMAELKAENEALTRSNSALNLSNQRLRLTLSASRDQLGKVVAGPRCNVHIDVEEFMALATFTMCNDAPNQPADLALVKAILEHVAVNTLGYTNWVEAYHELGRDVDA